MVADERMLEPQRALDAEVIVLPWIAPEATDSFATYARKLAATVDTSRPFYLGGASLGGMLAYEMGASMGTNLRGLILIAACDSYRGIPWLIRVIGRGIALLPPIALGIGKSLVPGLRMLFGIETKEQSQLFQAMVADTDPKFLKWSLGASLAWPGPVKVAAVPTLWIHGGRDLIVSNARDIPGVIVPGAGHTVNVTHAAEVNQIISDWLKLQENAPSAP